MVHICTLGHDVPFPRLELGLYGFRMKPLLVPIRALDRHLVAALRICRFIGASALRAGIDHVLEIAELVPTFGAVVVEAKRQVQAPRIAVRFGRRSDGLHRPLS